MDAELKSKWCAALRSGKYSQAQSVLKGIHGYCCLGVLRDVDDPTNVQDAGDADYLNSDDAVRFGLSFMDQKILAQMNDGDKERAVRRHSFAEIADYIEANL